MTALPGVRSAAGKALYGIGCIAASAVLAVSAISYYTQKQVADIATSSVASGGPSTGPMNILIMGLESRTYWDGTLIDHHLQHILNTGSEGGNATNTLILLHIFAGGRKAVAFSIPRDDYVQMVGTGGYGPGMNKVDAAYNAGLQARISADRKAHPSWTTGQVSVDAQQGGQQAAIETVQALTGVHVDKFAALNLVGFYELAAAFGGVYVCVKPWPGGQGIAANGNLRDPVVYYQSTGWQGSGSVVKPGVQHLTPEQALAFVRDRHNLPGGDITRTQRQQAVLDYVLWKLKTAGALSDLGKLATLMSTAKGYLAVPRGWNLIQFAGEMNALTGQNLVFHTLPSAPGPDIPLIGDVNTVDVPQIQAQVQQAFSAPAGGGDARPGAPRSPAAARPAAGGPRTPAAPATGAPHRNPAAFTVDVTNDSGHPGVARGVLNALGAKGYRKGTAQTGASLQSLTTVTFGPGAHPGGTAIARYFGPGTVVTGSGAVPAGHVLVSVGVATLQVPASLGGPAQAPDSPGAPSSATPTPTSGAANGDSISVPKDAPYGIPCVY